MCTTTAGRMIISVGAMTRVQYEAIYNRWKQLTQTDALTVDNINNLGHILCGAPVANVSHINLTDFE